ncbi:hypothetical protein JHK82_027584 [Glycine max]|uniref:Uncharacterized protein n=1 Tax=Glycine max TaxID=3847 RepID=A0A0R0HZJ9_SOYBN|nr:hypothetical protein JHK87_027473 [Glycine soja]KAG4996779.1 hypothetical protein JHK85_028218 [Glycine max]KAG5003572.1 hypothetical protein JHK86_027711 [Glycine max]KAG5126749.1 hypothetical protein JHK82_027584 [Glycine max]KAH1137590.1 hypothetical protein GYH30_027549 [Glycine max]
MCSIKIGGVQNHLIIFRFLIWDSRFDKLYWFCLLQFWRFSFREFIVPCICGIGLCFSVLKDVFFLVSFKEIAYLL